jgi:molybdopterin-guanine dinucleotide biosynthesis protein A
MTTAAIVLAGGRSERFGVADKLTARIDGATLIERAVAAVAAVTHDVVVVLPPGSPSLTVPPPARPAHDASEGEGPLAGAFAGLRAVAGADVAVIVGGDMPDLRPEVLRSMLARLDDPSIELVALDDGEGPRPLPIVVRTRPAAAAADALLRAGRRRLRDLLGTLRAAVLDPATWTALDPERSTLRDIDEPGDLNR